MEGKVNKKDLPLIIQKELNHLKNQYKKDCKIITSTKPMMRFEDFDEFSDFYFQINSFSSSNNDFIYTISCKPTSENDLKPIAYSFKFRDLENVLKSWIAIIQKFDETPHYDENPNIEFYVNEYFDEYQIIEDNADVEPFDLSRQILIDNYLDNSIKFLKQYEKKNKDSDLSEAINIAVEIKQSITLLSKNEVVKKLSKFWAVCRTKGLPIIKEVFIKLAVNVLTELGKKAIGIN